MDASNLWSDVIRLMKILSQPTFSHPSAQLPVNPAPLTTPPANEGAHFYRRLRILEAARSKAEGVGPASKVLPCSEVVEYP